MSRSWVFWKMQACGVAIERWTLERRSGAGVEATLRVPVALMWERRWTRLLAVAFATSFAGSLVPANHVT